MTSTDPPASPDPPARRELLRGRIDRGQARIAVLLARPQAPQWAFAVVLVFSLISRLIDLGQPCSDGCTSHTLIFDEAYYVNAARVIDGIHPPAGATYATAPLGVDPNSEHPQLAKLLIALCIRLFGDNPWGWRIGSLIFGTLALIAIFLLVRALTRSEWLAAAVAAVMSLDNLFLVHGRIATLDIYYLAVMIAAAVAYVQRRWILAALLVGIAAAMKETALTVLIVFVLYELFTERRRVLGAWRHLVGVWVGGFASLIVVLGICDRIASPYNPGNHTRWHSPFTELGHIVSVGKQLVAIAHATGISSTPWQWLINQKPIPYAQVAADVSSGGHLIAVHVLTSFEGEVNPFIIFLVFPALFVTAQGAWRGERIDCLALAWFLGTFLPLVFLSSIEHRITYLYYILEVMPAIYIACVRLFARAGRAATIGWAVALVYGLVALYPIRTF